MKITVKYYTRATGERVFSHKYDENWGKTDYYCPYCGKQEVFEEAGAGDYYLGTQALCIACEKTSYLENGGRQASSDSADRQRVDQIRKYA